MTTDVPSQASDQAKTQSFEADVSRLLHLMVHSVYSDRDIFVRELVSNAADACEKLRYEAIARPELIEAGGPFAIQIAIDPQAKTICFGDNGVGMSREELVEALGTIARSGTRAFLDRLAAADADKEAANLIGQFGIGFYSSFMVADEVVVETRRAGAGEAWRWSSDGKGAYTIAPLPLDGAPARGARVILHLNDASAEYLEPHRLDRIVREHSGAVAVPIDLIDKPGAEPRRVADGAAIWAKPKAEITPGGIRRVLSQPLRAVRRSRADRALARRGAARILGAGVHPWLASVRPVRSRAQEPQQALRPARAHHPGRDLLPGWLRFVRLVVDSNDLPLNVSREMIQQSAVFAAIRKGVTNRAGAGADQARRGRQGEVRQGMGAASAR